MSRDNLAAVQAIYAAFGRGDLPAVLDHLAEDVDWRVVGRAGDYPVFAPRRGRGGVAAFFAELAETAEVTGFFVDEIDAAGDKVFVQGRGVRTMRNTGREVENPWLQVFTFAGGKVLRFREYTDTAAIAEAYRGG